MVINYKDGFMNLRVISESENYILYSFMPEYPEDVLELSEGLRLAGIKLICIGPKDGILCEKIKAENRE